MSVEFQAHYTKSQSVPPGFEAISIIVISFFIKFIIFLSNINSGIVLNTKSNLFILQEISSISKVSNPKEYAFET